MSCPYGDPYMARLYLIPSDNFILTGAEKKDSCYVFSGKNLKGEKMHEVRANTLGKND